MRRFLFLCMAWLCMTAMAQPLAFPGAEGFGRYAVGGRGGKTLVVTNLNDNGLGSLRHAVEQNGPRTVVFAVSGTIELKTPLRVNNDSITIAGQTAPGDGICLKDQPLIVNGSNIIIRYLRVRLGDKYEHDNDAISGGRYGQHDVILDHLSVSFSIDECLSIYKTRNLTVQWCLVSHSLAHSRHTKGAHGFGGIWGGYGATFHHNLLANHSSRNPRFSSVEGTKQVDLRNNVVYNWGFKSAYGGGRHGEINMVGNYYKPGPASQHHRLLDVADDGTGRYYLSGNVMVGDETVTKDNWQGVGGKHDPMLCKVDEPFQFVAIDEQRPADAYRLILENVGCSLHRDSYDRSVLEQVEKGEAWFGNKGIIDSPDQAGGWPVLNTGKLPIDTDQDGMPDEWEHQHGLNPNNAADAVMYSLDKAYTNLEVYMNGLSKTIIPTGCHHAVP